MLTAMPAPSALPPAFAYFAAFFFFFFFRAFLPFPFPLLCRHGLAPGLCLPSFARRMRGEPLPAMAAAAFF